MQTEYTDGHAAYVLLAANIAVEKRLHSLSLLDHMSKIIANTSIRSYKPMSGQATEQIEGVQPLFQSCETSLFLQARSTGMLDASTSTALRKI